MCLFACLLRWFEQLERNSLILDLKSKKSSLIQQKKMIDLIPSINFLFLFLKNIYYNKKITTQ